MKSQNPTGRDSLITTAAHNARWFAGIVAGTTVLAVPAAHAVNNLWTGAVDADWNKTGNWSLGRVPAAPNGQTTGDNFDDSVVNSLTNFPILTVAPTASPRDIRVGSASGTTGRVDQRAGAASTGDNNWTFVGVAGGTGTYNLADTSAAGGTFTGFAIGSGDLTVGKNGNGGRLYVGGDDAGADAGIGTVNVNTSGSLIMRNDLCVGNQGGTGTFNLDNGTVTSGSAGSNAWLFIGQEGGHGTANMSGGSLSVFGRFYVGRNGSSTGAVNMSGGTVTKQTGEPFVVAENASTGVFTQSGGTVTTTGGELWVGQGTGANGTYNLSGSGTVNVGNWVAVGRDNGTGTLNMTGGTITKTGGGNFIVGASGPGTMTQSGGLVDVQTGIMWIAEQNSATATTTLSGTGEIRASEVILGVAGGTTGNLNLNGGTLRTSRISGGAGTKNVTFDGTQIVVSAQPANFISDLTIAVINSGGLKVNTNGFNATVPQPMGGAGGVVKSGAGTLTLSGPNLFLGSNSVLAGKLICSTSSSGPPGSFTVADGAGMGVIVSVDPEQFTTPSVSFGTSGNTTVDIVVDNSVGNPGAAPLKIIGNATLNGSVAVNLTDAFPEVGVYPMIQYGTKSGSGSFVLGTLPQGVIGTLSDNGSGLVSLNVTSVALPRWNATNSNNWDTTTINWLDNITSNPIKYTNGNPVLFDDAAAGTNPGTVTLTEVVTPGSVTFDNDGAATSNIDYVVGATGVGAISGSTGITKLGTGDVNLTTDHTYTGVTRIEGGTLTVATLANGGTASPIGAATADPANLALAGGTLRYTGPSTTINRGLTHAGATAAVVSGIETTNDLTLSGQITVSSFGRLLKTGTGTLTLTNPGTNVLASGGGAPAALRVNAGSLALTGGGTQVNQVNGELWLGSAPDVAANMVLTNTTLHTASWIAMGRGNGSTGTITNLTATNSTIQSVNFSTGFDAGLANNNSVQNITLNNSTVTNNGATLLAESLNSHTTLTLNGTSSWTANDRFQIGLGDSSSCDVVINDSGSLTKTAGWLSIGNSGTGTGSLTVNDNGTVNSNGDFNIGDVGTSQGVLNINDAGSVTSTGIVFVGKNTGTGGIVNQTGGTFTCTTWLSNARFTGSTGAINVSGGSFNQTGAGQMMFVAEEGSGVVTLSGTGAINVTGTALNFGNAATASGTFHLDGGTLTVRQLIEGGGGAGASAFNFDGGTLKAGANANANFMGVLDTVTVEDGGAIIDSNGQTIAINSALLDGGAGGGLTKLGAGTLYMNSSNTYLGLTTVSAGTLGGTGAIAGSISVANGATLSAGAPTGTMFADENVSFQSGANFGVTINDASPDASGTLVVEDNLNLTNANLVLTGTPALATYIIASYGTLTGTFATVPTLPAGYSINYNYNGQNQIAIVRPPSVFEAWIGTFFPGETDQSIVGPNADADSDDSSNALEFALGGAPDSATNGPKVYHLVADSSDGGTANELLMTIAVRNGTPVFAGSPSPTATQDGYTYTVQGSTNLATFTSAVSVVTPVTTGLPAAPTGYTYRTFSLDSSEGLSSPNRGFLRVSVTP